MQIKAKATKGGRRSSAMSKPRAIPVPLERLEAMRIALLHHGYNEELRDCIPLSPSKAMEIAEALEMIEGYFSALGRRPARVMPENLKAAQLARCLHEGFGWNKLDAAVAAFPGAETVDAESLAKTVRNLLPKTRPWPCAGGPTSIEIIAAMRRYRQLNLGELPKRKARRK